MKFSLFCIVLGLALWARKEIFTDNTMELPPSQREKVQQIDARLYR